MILIEPPIRGQDAHGNGAYQAPRGDHKHNGVDLSCYKGSKIYPCRAGEVTKIGYPYNPNDNKKGYLRYIQVTDADGFDHRYFYVKPLVQVGDHVDSINVIGLSQGLEEIYTGITDHIHFEVKLYGAFVDPRRFL